LAEVAVVRPERLPGLPLHYSLHSGSAADMNMARTCMEERASPIGSILADHRDGSQSPKCDVAMSVIVPTSGRVDLLQETLTSLSQQTFRGFEVIIADDSADETDRDAIRQSCSAFAESTGLRTRYVFSRPRLFQAANTNQGIRCAKGNLLRILHSDDLLRADAIETEVATFADQPGLEVLFEDVIPFCDRVDWQGTADRTLVSPAHHLRTHLSHCTAVPSGLVFSSAALRDAGPMDERLRFLCDWDFFCRLLVTQIEKRNPVGRLSAGLVGWRTHADSVTGRLWRTHFIEHELFIREFWQSKRIGRLNLFTAYESAAFRAAAKHYRYQRVCQDYRRLSMRDKIRFAPWFIRHALNPGSLRLMLPALCRKAVARVAGNRQVVATKSRPRPQPQASTAAPPIRSEKSAALAIAPFYDGAILDGHAANWVLDFDNTLSLWPMRNQLAATRLVRLFYPNINRMYQRTLHEVLKYISVGNAVEIVMTGNHHLQWFGLKASIAHLFPGQFTLVRQEKDEHEQWRIVFRRAKAASEHYVAAHTGWTFGLLTLGDKPERALAYLASIKRACRGPHEIVVVCPRRLPFLARESRVRQIVFSDRDDVGWITKKKNLICDAAKYSDILVCHDRFALTPTFCSDFDSWGYAYGIAAPRLRLPNGRRAVDWAVVSSQNHVWSSGGLLDYRSYSPYVYVPGGATIVRKEFWRRFPWDENFYWNEHEDVELCRRAQRHGEIIHLAGAALTAESDRWTDHNPPIPFCPETEYLFGRPVGEQLLRFI
jgi:GT2 family glycosyltransferase